MWPSAKDFFVYWIHASMSVVAMLTGLLFVSFGGLLYLGAALTEYGNLRILQKQTHAVAFLQVKEYLRTNMPTLRFILVVFLAGFAFCGPYHFDQQQRLASSTISQQLQDGSDAAKRDLGTVTTERNELRTELEALRNEPLDPSLMTAGDAFGIAGQIHRAISRFASVVLIVTAPTRQCTVWQRANSDPFSLVRLWRPALCM